MEYLKEFQAFAGRFSAAAEDKLARVDGGTYNEFFRFYSQLWPTEAGNNAADDEQRQMDILLEELQMAMESPSLLSAPEGSVLHAGAVETGVGSALSQLCVALEKCLFFGAAGSTPDFWWVLSRTGGEDPPAAVAEPVFDPSTSSAHGNDSVDSARALDEANGTGVVVGIGSAPTETASMSGVTPEPLFLAVRRLTCVRTGHGRCRAWARGLLGMDAASAERELRRGAEVAAAKSVVGVGGDIGAQEKEAGPAAAGEGGNRDTEGEVAEVVSHRGDTSSSTEGQPNVSQSDPDAGGGGGNGGRGRCNVSPVARVISCVDENDCPAVPRPGALPLWMRRGPQGLLIVDDLCRFLREFQGRLGERGLSVRPSLDHAWLDQENIAAATTYTWPRFRREWLRCYVLGAGFPMANGEYSPAEMDEGEGGGSFTLVGPNGCQIYRQMCSDFNSQTQAPTNGIAVIDEEKGLAMEAPSVVPAPVQTATTNAPAPVAQLWCLLVPLGLGMDRRSAYYALGDGALPPSRGWRATDATYMPAPVLGFATQHDDELDAGERGGEHHTRDGGAGTSEALFGAAVSVVEDEVSVVGGTAVVSEAGKAELRAAAAGASVQTGKRGTGLRNPPSGGRLARRLKRRRPPEVATVRTVEGVSVAAAAAADTHKGHQVDVLMEDYYLDRGNIGRGGGGGDRRGRDDADIPGPWFSASEGDRSADCKGVGAGTGTQGGGKQAGEDGAVAAFKAERWRLPAPSGEWLLRAERTAELLRQTGEKRASMLAFRKSQLLDEVAATEAEYQEVLEESTTATVERVLASRPHLRDEAEAEAAREAQAVAAESIGDGRSELEVPSLEELVAEKAEELRTRPQDRSQEETTRSSPVREDLDRNATPLIGVRPTVEFGWPWPTDWLSAPRVPIGDVEIHDAHVDSGGFAVGHGDVEADDGDRKDTPPFAIEVAAVEVADVEDPDDAHIEYVLRVVYHEVRGASGVAAPTSAVWGDGGYTTTPNDDPGATELMTVAAAAKGLLQRTRVLSKRLNSLCALHPRLMWELAEGRRLRPGGVEIMEPLAFPDPFELGTLEESVLRIHRDKLTPRFKANSPTRKLSARIGSYLSGLLHFLGVLEATGYADVRACMARALNEALSTCDRAGRKRRRGDFVLGVRIEDIGGGRLESLGGDEDRLRIQKRSCMGCGRAIAAEFLGIKKDYFPCRFANGLFCRSYCHSEDRRVIPHRVVHHWDFNPHRVCKDSAAFLDATRFLPVVRLQEECPRLFVEHQSLRLVRSRRKQLRLLRHTILFPSENKCAPGARVLEKNLDGRMHLAIDPDLYSVADLIGAKKGSLVDFLEEAVEALLAHVMDDCDTCETRSAQVCNACYTGDPISAFQVGTVARCPSCGSLFHGTCVAGKGRGKSTAAGSSKWVVDQAEADDTFVCPHCAAVAPMADVLED